MASKQAASSSLPLFREAAFSRFRKSVWQPPLLSKPPSNLIVGTSTVLAVLALTMFATTFKFARKETATGHLAPIAGWSRVSAQSFGVVQQRFVEAGDRVETGDVLFEMTSGVGLNAGVSVETRLLEGLGEKQATFQAQLAAIQRQFENERALMKREREAAEQQIDLLKTEIGSGSARLAIARQRYRDGQRLKASGALSESDLLELADRVQSLSSMVVAPQRELARHQTILDTHEQRLLRLELNRERDEATILDHLHALAMEESRLRARNAAGVLAPRAGRVASVLGNPGDWLSPGDPLLDIVPEGSGLKARLYATSSAIGTVEVGQEVRIYLDAFPYEKHGAQIGRVVSISETPISQREAPASVDGVATAGPLFRIDVEFPDGFSLSLGQRQSLRPGMTISADMVSAYGTLYDWLLEPLQGAAQRL